MENQPRIADFRIAQIFDDDKFTDMAIRLFESVYPGKSDYYVLTGNRTDFTYVTSALAKPVVLDTPQHESDFIYQIETSAQAVFLHAMSHKRQQIALRLSDAIVKVWFIWGYDLYGKWPMFNRNLFERETAKYISRNKKMTVFTQNLRFNQITFKLFLSNDKRRLRLPNRVATLLRNTYQTPFYKAIRLIDIVAPVIPTEYDLVKTLHIKARFAPFTYGTLEHLLGDKIDDNVLQARNLLVGNSADPSNNHADIFKRLAQVDLDGRKVYVPLSYAGNEDYKAFVIRKGREYLGEHFVPLTDFMPLTRYNEIIAGCGFLIFNHTRQQGVGNIIWMGAMGAKVFLNEKSTVYSFYKSLGIKVFSTNAMTARDLDDNLDEATWQHNRKIYFEHYSTVAVQQKARQLLAIVNEEVNNKMR